MDKSTTLRKKESALSGYRQSRKQKFLEECFAYGRLTSMKTDSGVTLRGWLLRNCLAEREVKIDFKRPRTRCKAGR